MCFYSRASQPLTDSWTRNPLQGEQDLRALHQWTRARNSTGSGGLVVRSPTHAQGCAGQLPGFSSMLQLTDMLPPGTQDARGVFILFSKIL